MKLGALIFLILAAAFSHAAELPQATAYEELVLEVRVNGQDLNEMLVVLRDESGGYWLDAADFARLRLNPPSAPAHEQGQRRYLPLSALRGAQLSVDAIAVTAGPAGTCRRIPRAAHGRAKSRARRTCARSHGHVCQLSVFRTAHRQ